MNNTSTPVDRVASPAHVSASTPKQTNRLPWSALFSLASAGFLAIMSETIPAGLLPLIAAGLNITESGAGQFVSIYALGSLLAAIPLINATRRFDRKYVLLSAVAMLLVANALTAVLSWYPALLLVRFIAGAAAALVWGVIAGYARGIVAPALQGRALTVTGIGQPIALAAGIPIGTFLGGLVGWRSVFLLIAAASLALIFWIALATPRLAGAGKASSTDNRSSTLSALSRPGVRPVLFATFALILAHNTLYTYIAPVLANTGIRLEVALAVFGITAFIGIFLTGVVIDRKTRLAALIAFIFVGAAAFLLGLPPLGFVATLLAVAVWGLGFGGTPVFLQTVLADRAGQFADSAQAMLIVAFNAGVAGGGVIGGLILATGAPSGTLGFTSAAFVALAVFAMIRRRETLPSSRVSQ
jgi:predicted MFS family arabinose efflux permease